MEQHLDNQEEHLRQESDESGANAVERTLQGDVDLERPGQNDSLMEDDGCQSPKDPGSQVISLSTL